MRIDIVTAFPSMFDSPSKEGILKIAKNKGILNLKIHNLRDYTTDKHKQIDDTPYGGGPGMLLKVEPFYRAIKKLTSQNKETNPFIILLTPQGETLKQKKVRLLAKKEHLILLCGHYEGVDERVRSLIDEEISIGDYILSGGEFAAMVLADAITRKLEGVLGSEESLKEESFEKGMLEYPQYTKPAKFNELSVPKILLSGNHQKIKQWRQEKAVERTRVRRPDLYQP